jgi:YegS/Rv2252/BmrU family lipid kinase
MSVAIIINPIAGGRVRPVGDRVELARRAAAAVGQAADIFVTEQPGHARSLARAARGNGARLVVAWGGDGTINEVATELAHGPVPIGIVASGSGNGLARELKIPANPARALAAAFSAVPRAMDLGEIDGRLFVNLAGIGFDAHVASRFNDAANPRRGLMGYAAIAARSLASYAAARYSITTDEGTVAVRAILVTVANSPQFGNGARIAPAARVDDGFLDLVIVEERSRARTVWHIRRLFTGTIEKMGGCTARRITAATIACEGPMTFHVDGEPIAGGNSLRVRVHPGALQIAAP